MSEKVEILILCLLPIFGMWLFDLADYLLERRRKKHGT